MSGTSAPAPSSEPTVVIVPGLRDHVPDHWQTHLAGALGAAGVTVHTVPPLTRDHLSRAARVAALDEVLSRTTGPVVLAAHSAGVVTTVHWAAQGYVPSERPFHIRGALLATPPDFATPMPVGYPAPDVLAANGWTPVPRKPLPFPGIVASSTDDPLCAPEAAAALAGDWGLRLVELGPVGHLNPASGFGAWPQAEALLHDAAV